MDVKRAFKAVKGDADLSDLRFHDLRHTAITRMVKGGISSAEAGKLAGHSQPQTTYRYINTDTETISRAASVLDEYSKPLITNAVEAKNQNDVVEAETIH